MTPMEKAERSKQLLNDPLITAAFQDIRMALVAKLEETPIGDLDTQHEVTLYLQLIKQVKERLQGYVDEQTVDEHRKKQDSFLERARETYAKLRA